MEYLSVVWCKDFIFNEKILEILTNVKSSEQFANFEARCVANLRQCKDKIWQKLNNLGFRDIWCKECIFLATNSQICKIDCAFGVRSRMKCCKIQCIWLKVNTTKLKVWIEMVSFFCFDSVSKKETNVERDYWWI